MPMTDLEKATEALAAAIQDTEEFRTYRALKELVMEDDTNRALLKEYQKAQMTLQMAAMAGKEADDETVERFSRLSDLLYMNNDVAQYLLAQLRMQKLAGEVFQALSRASELEFETPGM
jgi:cell fate (sporulation/competence/biofilm development) regulator YlbF (YheA/YmcA/DUF963 family)